MSQSELPIEFSYKVSDYFFAGEYPFEKLTDKGMPKLQRLLDFGIKHFIDLTSEPLTKYIEFLPTPCTYAKSATSDYTVPDFFVLKEIHDRITEAEKQNEKIYIHCKGGHDRTGAVVATYFIYLGLSPAKAKEKFRTVFVPPVKGRYPHRPLIETDWKVLNEYKKYLVSRRNIKLIRKPETIIGGVKCPFCKTETLGILEIPLDNTRTVFRVDCLNVKCVLNYRAIAPSELETMVKEALKNE